MPGEEESDSSKVCNNQKTFKHTPFEGIQMGFILFNALGEIAVPGTVPKCKTWVPSVYLLQVPRYDAKVFRNRAHLIVISKCHLPAKQNQVPYRNV